MVPDSGEVAYLLDYELNCYLGLQSYLKLTMQQYAYANLIVSTLSLSLGLPHAWSSGEDGTT